MDSLDLAGAKERAEKKLGITIDQETAASVLEYAARKCTANRKDTSYLEILYETELCDHFRRMAINAISQKGAAYGLL